MAAEAQVVTASSAQYFVAGLRAFLRFCFLEDLLPADLAGAALAVTGRRRSPLPRGISCADARALLASCDRRRPAGRRDYALLVTLLRLGLRASEAAALRLEDIDWRAGEITVHGKGRRDERLPLPADVGQAIVAYLTRGRPAITRRGVFVRVIAPAGPLHREGVSDIVRRACRRAGIGEVGAHRLRHTAAPYQFAGRGAGARGVPPAGSRGCADHAGDVCACDRGSRDARGGRVACAGRAMADRGCRRRADRAMLMTRHLNSAGEPAAAGPGGPDGLWAPVPDGLRSPRLSPDTVPEEYRSAFRHYGDGTRDSRGRTPADLTVLPDGLRKEITWCMFRIADLGGVIGMSGAATVVRMLGAAVAGDNGPAVLSQVSLLDASVQEWCQRIRAVFYRDSGRFPSPSTMRCVAYELQRYSRVLEAAYDTRDWWQREVWRPTEDTP